MILTGLRPTYLFIAWIKVINPDARLCMTTEKMTPELLNGNS